MLFRSAWQRPGQLAHDVRVAFGYGRRPRTDLQVIAQQMALGRWAFALTCLLYAVEESDLPVTVQQEGALRNLITRLEVKELPERFGSWL